MFYAVQYGSGNGLLASKLGITADEAGRMKERWVGEHVLREHNIIGAI